MLLVEILSLLCDGGNVLPREAKFRPQNHDWGLIRTTSQSGRYGYKFYSEWEEFLVIQKNAPVLSKLILKIAYLDLIQIIQIQINTTK